MAKQLNVNMAFTANTSQAKQQIQELQRSLSNLYTSTAKDPTLSMREGVQAALTDVAKLKIALEQATNAKTGNLDLSQFSIQLQKSQLDMTKLSNSFINLGEQGQQAFMQLAQSIITAETPMRQTNALLGTMWTTLKNVARFQISSSLIHGFIGGIQTAHNYAKDLNQSLNNIRIVTGQDTEQMAKFAEQANKTARALSATTLDYTNASLIYYQQGLDDAAVAERTATTIKLANVSRQSAQEVSDQMTAIWNNFDDGSHSLEYYADVITALGAATASSSAEIAGGLEKFASVAETVGLSYEYATTALATIVATTRQSEDTVGTGLRTIFSRLQGLKLGETLEDGTDLTKYSQALATIGVNIKDQNGELKEMDQILNEIGAKWETLTKDQQVALAQTVGGVRQYTNLVALFDKWDQFQKNLTVATGAEGTLQTQADIYAESWEGARDRVKAAAEKIYSDLLDEDFFISLNKGIETILVGIDKLINNIGGIPGVLSLVATAMMTAFGPQISAAINQLVQNIQIMRGTAEQKSIEVKEATIAAVRSFNQGFTAQNEFDRTNSSAVLGGEVTERQIQRTIDLQRQVSALSEEERKYRQELIELEAQYGKNAIAAKKAAEASQAKISDLNRINRLNIRDKQGTAAEAEYQEMSSGLKGWVKETIKAHPKLEDFDKLLQEEAITLRNGTKDLQISSNQIYKLGQAYAANARDTEVAKEALSNYDERIKETDSLMSMSIAKVQSFGEKFVQIGRTLGQASMAINSIKGLFNTLSNPDASGLDKITAVLTTIAMTAPLAASVLTKLTTATNAYFAANMKSIVSQGLITAGISAETAATAANIIAKNADKFTTAALSTEKGKEAAITLLSASIKDEDAVAAILDAIAHGKLTTATLAHTAAMIKQKVVMLATNPIFWIVIAAVTALTAAIWLGVKAYQADAANATAAANAAKELGEKSKEAAEKAQEIKDIFSKYDTAVEALNECTKGTEEWYAALKNVNDIILDILQNNPELAASLQTHRDENGMLVVDNAKELITQADKAAEQAKYAAVMGNVSAAQARLISNQTNAYRQFAEYEGEGETADFEAVQRNLIRRRMIQNASDYLGLTKEEFQTKALAEGLSLAGKGLEDFYNAIQTLGQESDNLSNQMEIAGNLIAEQELGDKFDAATKEISSENYEKLYTDIYNKILKDEDKITKWAGANNKDVKALWERYSKATGTNYSLSTNAVQGSAIGSNTADRSYEYINAEGKKVQVSIREMAAAIAASEALEQLGASATQAATILNNIHIDENAGYSDSDIRNYIASRNFENSTAGSINAMQDAVEEAGSTQAYLEKIFGGADRLKALADLYGITVEDFITNFENSLNAIDFSSIGQNLSAHAQAAFEIGQKNMESLTYKQQSNLASLYQTTFNELGQSGLDVLNGSIEQLSKNGKLDEFEAIASAFDWSSGSIADFKQQCIDAGIAVDALNLDPWIEGMIAARKEVENFATAASKYKKLHDIIDDIEIGDTITEEQYKDLGAGYEEYFVLMADGTYKLVGDAQEFYNAVNKQSLEGFVNNATQAYENKSTIESISSRYNLRELRGTAGVDVANEGYKVNNSKVNAQLDFLDTQGVSDTNIEEIKADVEAGKELNYEQVKYLAEAVQEASAGYKTWDDVLQQFDGDAEKAEEAIATSARTTEELSAYTREYNLSQDASIAGLKAIASQYEECHEELDDYNQTVKTYTKDSEQARAAQQRLWKAVRNQEWGKLTDEISDYVITLNSSSSSAEEIKKANKEIAKSFNKTFNTNITEDWVDDNKELFQEWANASEEEANDVAEKILDLAKIDSIKDMEPIDLSNKFKMPVDVFEGLKTKWKDVKSILEANPIKVDAYGNADMSQLVASLLEAGYTAEEVAGVLAAIGQTDVSLNGFDTGVLEHYDLTTQEGIEGFTKGLKSWKGNIDTASGQYPTVGGGSASADMTKINNTGSGGGGGGSSNKTHDTKERDGEDRYRPIKAKQEDKSRQIDQAREKAERIAGKARIDNLREENKLLGDNIKLQQQYINEINNYLAQDKSDMLSKFGAFGISFNFDENGVINNYDSIMDKMYAIYNEKANQELDEDTWNDFEEEWQAAIDALEQYIETRDLAEEETANLTDMINEQFDKLLEITATKLELDLQVNDQDLEFLDYLLNKIDDDAYKAAEAIALMGDKAARELERANYYQNAINQTLAAYGIYSMEQLANMSSEELQNLGITQDTIDNLIDWNNELLSTAETLDELQSEIIDKVISGFDDLNEKVQDSYDYFSHWNTVLENYRDIVDLNMSALGGKQARDLIKTIDNSMLKNSVNALRSSKQIYDDLVKGRAEAEAKLQEAVAAGRIGDIKRYEDVLADIDEKIKDSQEQWLSDWSDGLQKAQDILTRAVEDAVAEYDKLLSPVYGSLDYLNEAYDRGKEVDEDYVQDYEKLYQLNKLNRDLTKVLNDTDGVKNREQLIKLQEKINKLQKDKTKMSEYDLEVLRKEFEVQQARIALEEAANAKSTVRLQRDNEGNWGYVYTSDFDSTEELQQSYEDKLHEYQQLNDEYMSEMSDQLMELSQNARDRISEIWSDATLTQEEKEARVAEVMKWFNAQRDYIEEQMGHAIDNQAALTDRFYATYQNMQAEVRDTFAETVLSQTTNIQQLSEMTGLLTTGVANLVEAGRLASLEYLASMQEINEAAGSTMQDLADNITNATNEIDIASSANVETISELSEVVQEELVNALDSAITEEEKLAASIAETTAAIENQTAALNNMLRILNGASGGSIEINSNPLDTLTQSEEKYGINQPAYNENDWLLNKELEEIFDAVYDREKWGQSHNDFLEMYGAMSDWLTLLQTQAGSAMQGFGSIMSPYYQTPESETLEQQVHIEANFPGVTNSSEIEEAFENLVNKAAQFANRKRQG